MEEQKMRDSLNKMNDNRPVSGYNGRSFAEETQERLAKQMDISSIHDKRIWRVADVAEFLGCSEWHIYRLTSDEKIPYIKKGKFVYFVPHCIQNWVLEGNLK